MPISLLAIEKQYIANDKISHYNLTMKKAFSLVELSIVLVILGLLVGGVLAGQSLIRAAELRAVSTEYSRYSTATRSFRDKYFAFPGDLNNAESFWGTDAGGCPGTSATTSGPGIATCNGDGNGQVGASGNTSEMYRFWQHMANAGMIEGSFTGVPNTTNITTWAHSTSTPNVPKSKMANGMWFISYTGVPTVGSTSFFDGTDLGSPFFFSNAANVSSTGPILKPEEAWNIDTKMDDGKPGTGGVQTMKNPTQANATTGCSDQAYTTTVSIASSSNYLLSNSNRACSLIIKSSF